MKINILKPLLTIACLLCSIGVYAHDFEVDGIYYNITSETDQTVEVTFRGNSYNSYSEYTGTVEIPESVTYNGVNYSVTSIGESAFRSCFRLTKVTIPNSVTSIGNRAFSGCTGLTTLNFNAENCTTMGSYLYPVFEGCTNLKTLNIGESVKTIPAYAFEECTGLTEVTIGNSVTSIGDYAFYECTGLTEVTIPDGVTLIGANAFGYCTGLKTVNFNAENCTTMGSSEYTVFGGCSNLTAVNIGESVKTIPNYAFLGCTGLTEVTIPNSVTSIGNWAFSNCTGLTEVTIPNSVTSIGFGAFNDCTGLKSLTIEDGDATLKIRYNYFSSSSKGEGLFYDCPIETLYIGRNLSYSTDSDFGYSPFARINELKTVTIGNSVTSIGDCAFYYCTGLTEVTIPNSVTSIGDRAFYYCTGLTEITIPNSVTSIGNWAFSNCTRLTGVYITDLSAWCGIDFGNATANPLFYAHNLYINNELVTSLVIPNDVPSMGNYAFSGCTSLTSIVVDKDNPTYDSRDNCNAIIETATNTLIVGCSTTVIPNSVTSIGDFAFYATKIAEVTIPNSVTSIGEYAFAYCYGLTEVTIPNSVTSIGYGAFYYCIGLTTLICEATLPPTIGYDIFFGANADIYISYRSSDAYKSTSWGNLNLNFITQIIDDVCYVVTNIADREAGIIGVANKGISIVTLQDSILQDSILHDTFRVTSIEADAFKDCIDLDEIIVSSSVEYIGNSAFEGCTGLRTVTIGSGVNEIGENTFTGCDRIKTVNCYAEVPPTIYSNTFTVYTNDNATLHVVQGCKDAYADAKYWKYFMNITDDLISADFIVSKSIVLDQTNITAIAGETVVLTATIYPEDATEKGVMWSVSDATIATIEPLDSLSAKITVLREGVATITATTIDGSNLSATCTIDVYSDIEALLRDSEDVEYYDLNGFRIENPTRGIYIMKQGNTVKKVVLKN